MTQWEQFIEAMGTHVPEGSHLIVMSVYGDPDEAEAREWWGKAYKPWEVDDKQNVYVTIGAFKRDEDGKLRRKDRSCAGMVGIVFDDVGTGLGSRGSTTIEQLHEMLPSTADIVTSDNNYQVVYLFDCLMIDLIKFKMIISAIIVKFFNGKDPGMHGLTRIFRPGVGRNLKKKYQRDDGRYPQVYIENMDLSRRYSPNEIVKAFGLVLEPMAEKDFISKRHRGEKQDRIDRFQGVMMALNKRGFIQERPGGNHFDPDGWVRCKCPFADGDDSQGILPHSGGGSSGAQIRKPNAENDYFGSFVCFHSHGQRNTTGKPNEIGWKHLVRWTDDRLEMELNLVNASAARKVDADDQWLDYINSLNAVKEEELSDV